MNQSAFLPIWEDISHEERLQYANHRVVSVSGGIDSFHALIKARKRWPDEPLIAHHQYLPEAWAHDVDYLRQQCAIVDNCRLVVSQGMRELTGGETESGAYTTTMTGLHTIWDGEKVADPLPVDDSWQDGRPANMPGRKITSLLDFAVTVRGAPPTKKIRYCTAYFKADVWDRWFRESGMTWVVLISGERHAESEGRKRLPEFQWRFGRQKNDVWWWRPSIDLKFHQVLQEIVDFCGDKTAECVPASYGWQHASGTLEGFINDYLSPSKDEKRRPRHSCVRCIFTHRSATENLQKHRPDVSKLHDDRTDAAERVMGMTWRQQDARKQ